MITVTQSISGKYFSANIPDVEFSISGTSALVKMSIDGEEIYNEILFPVGGKIGLADLSSLVEPYAKKRLTVALAISIAESTADGKTSSPVTMSADIVFSAADVPTTCEDFCATHFLTTLVGSKTTAMGRLEYLHYIGTDSAEVTAFYDDRSSKTFPLLPVGGNSKYTTIDVSPAQFALSGKALIRYEVVAGGRSQMFNIDLSCPDCSPVLLFVNSFGVDELLYCTGTHKIAPSRKRDTMYVRNLMKNYHIEETRAMTADTGVLSFEEAQWAEDLLRSEYVRLVTFRKGAPNVGKEIIITEDKAERDNNDDTLPRISFTYHLAQRNHNVLEIQREGRIFDNTFDNTFN